MDDEYLLKALGANDPNDPIETSICRNLLKTSEGRGKLITSMIKPAEMALDVVKSRMEREPLYALKTIRLWNTRIWLIQQCFDGSEEYDKVVVSSLLEDLRASEASIVSNMKTMYST